MNEISCEVIQDLIEGCADGTASRATVKLVLEHIKMCDECRAKYEALRGGKKARARKWFFVLHEPMETPVRYLRWSILALAALTAVICMIVNFAKTVRAIRELCPGTTVETLISDMKMNTDVLDTVIAAHPEVLNHNVETVRELQRAVRPQADYERSLSVLRYCKQKEPTLLVKTGFMVGLGETDDQIDRLMDDILETGCDILTIGQYLQPSAKHYPLARYATPEDFARYKELALKKGFRHVASAPLARSSYKAWEVLEDAHDLY